MPDAISSLACVTHESLSGDCRFQDDDRTLLGVVSTGRARFRAAESDEQLLGTGSVLLIPRGAELTLRSAEAMQLQLLRFDAERLLPRSSDFEAVEGLDAALRGLSGGAVSVIGISPKHAAAVSDALGRIEAELREPRLGQALLLRARLLELLVVLARAVHVTPTDPTRHRPRLERTLGFIHDHFQESLSLSALARHAGMSVSRFSCLFREVLGASPLEYVASTRMREARRLLRTPGQSIAEVAYAVGFQDSNYFSRSFKQHHGMSPREFREVARIAG